MFDSTKRLNEIARCMRKNRASLYVHGVNHVATGLPTLELCLNCRKWIIPVSFNDDFKALNFNNRSFLP